jgi:hypothetical protein
MDGQIFASRAATSGGIVRRSLCDVDWIVGRTRFLHEIERRGYRAIENARQVVIFCNRDPVRPFALTRSFEGTCRLFR